MGRAVSRGAGFSSELLPGGMFKEEVAVAIDSLTVLHRHLPTRAPGLVFEWGLPRQTELGAAWELAMRLETLGGIAPLK